MIPIGINLTSIGVSSKWWLESAQAVEQAGFASVWCWDHFISQGKDKTMPVLECWTTLTAAAAATSKLKVGSFINNVMNRHPAVLARMLATLCDQAPGRVELGIGVGGSGRRSARTVQWRHALRRSVGHRVAAARPDLVQRTAPSRVDTPTDRPRRADRGRRRPGRTS